MPFNDASPSTIILPLNDTSPDVYILVALATPNVGVVKVGEVNVLFVNVSVPANVANVPVVGNVISVAAVLVKVEAKPPAIANVAFVGIVNVPSLPVIDNPFIDVALATPNVGVVKVGEVNVLLVNVSVPAKVANVPAVGNVTLVAAVEVNVEANPPTIANVAFDGIVNVPSLPVIVKPFIVVAVAAPKVGVVNEGDTKFANVPVTVGKVKETPDEL